MGKSIAEEDRDVDLPIALEGAGGMEPLPSRVRARAWPHVLAMDFVTRTARPIPGIRESETEDRLEYCSELRDAIGCLPRLQRLVLLADLAAQGTAPANELAAKFGTSRSSIYVSRSNGRRALFAILKERGLLRVERGRGGSAATSHA